jgi:hypothetical protein
MKGLCMFWPKSNNGTVANWLQKDNVSAYGSSVGGENNHSWFFKRWDIVHLCPQLISAISEYMHFLRESMYFTPLFGKAMAINMKFSTLFLHHHIAYKIRNVIWLTLQMVQYAKRIVMCIINNLLQLLCKKY